MKMVKNERELIAKDQMIVAAVMSAGRAKPVSRPETDRLFGISDRVRVTIR